MSVKTTIRYFLKPKDGEPGATGIGVRANLITLCDTGEVDNDWIKVEKTVIEGIPGLKWTQKGSDNDPVKLFANIEVGKKYIFSVYTDNVAKTWPQLYQPSVIGDNQGEFEGNRLIIKFTAVGSWDRFNFHGTNSQGTVNFWGFKLEEVLEGEQEVVTAFILHPKDAKGAAGKDGKDFEFIFTRNNTGVAPSAPSTSQVDDYVPEGWTDDPVGVTSSMRFEYVSKREKINGIWGAFSTPSFWTKWSADGKPGENAIDIHISRVNIPVQCDSNGNPLSLANTGLSIKLMRGGVTLWATRWYDDVGNGGDYHVGATADGVSGFTLPTTSYLQEINVGNITGLTKDVGTVTLTFTIYDYKNHSTYEVQRVISYVKNKDGKDGTDGTDGIDGTDGASQLVAYKRSLSKPATPSPSTSTPPGWYDTPDYAVDNLNVTGISVENCAGSIAAAQPGEREPYLWKKQDDGFHKSPPISHNDHVRCRLIFETTLANTTVKVQLKVSSEQGYDKLHVGRLDTALNVNYADSLALRTISGSREETLSVAVSSAGIHFLDFIYKKDGSGSVGLDAGQFKLEGAVERIWMTRCAVVGGVCQGWSIPVMYQDKPADTIIPYPDGVWSEFSEYERTERHAPYVEHEGEYYLLVKPGLIGEGSNPNPWEDYAVNRGTGTWDRMDKFDMVFTKILLAEFAKLGSAVFTTNRMISQQGKKNGIASYAYQEYAGDGGAWQPNILLDFLTGGGHFAARNIRWTPDGWLYARRIIPDVQISSNVLSIGEYLEDPNTPEILILCRPSGGTLPAYIDELPTPSANYIGKNLILYNNTIGWHGQAEVEGSMFYKNPSSLSFDSNGNMQNHNTYSGHLTKIKLKPGVGVYMTCVPYVAGGSYSTYTGYTWWIREIFYCPCYENQ